MTTPDPPGNRRVLIIDDNESIHADIRKTLGVADEPDHIGKLTASMLGVGSAVPKGVSYDIDSAHQGQEGLEKVLRSLDNDTPYALAFVDMRMPPGWDGLETIERIWEVDPKLQIVICTAYSDYILGHHRRTARNNGSTAHPQEAVRRGGNLSNGPGNDGEMESGPFRGTTRRPAETSHRTA